MMTCLNYRIFKLQLTSVYFILLLIFPTIYGSFDHWQLVLTWPAGFCKIKGCPRKQIPNNFTIHGLWPDNLSFVMFDCRPNIKFNGIKDKKDQVELEKCWPELTAMPYVAMQRQSFWKYQYEKHGTCCSEVYTESAYFDLAIRLKEKTDLLAILRSQGISPGSTYTGDQINSSITSVTKALPNIKCLYHQGTLELTEIGICFNREADGIKSCPRVSNSCKLGTNTGLMFR